MSEENEAVQQLVVAQEDLPWVHITKVDGCQLEVRIDTENPDGTCTPFDVRIKSYGREITAFDGSEKNNLPPGCFDRHIMFDGSFCLGWEGDDEFTNSPQTYDERIRWWRHLAGFMRLQLEANLSGYWRKNCGWKHSEKMAGEQQRIEIEEALLPPEIRRIVDAGERSLMPVYDSSRERVSTKLKQRRRACPCGSTKQLRHCHEKSVVEMIYAKKNLEQSQHKWLEAIVRKGMRCCGTLKYCELRQVQEKILKLGT